MSKFTLRHRSGPVLAAGLLLAVIPAYIATSYAIAATTGAARQVPRHPHHHDPSELTLSPVLLSVVVAVATVLLHLWLKWASTEPPAGKRHGFVREDLAWWFDLVVVAIVALGIYALSTAAHRATLHLGQSFLVGVALVGGIGVLPTFVRNLGYTKTTPPRLRTWVGVFIPNVLGMLILLATIASGAKLAG